MATFYQPKTKQCETILIVRQHKLTHSIYNLAVFYKKELVFFLATKTKKIPNEKLKFMELFLETTKKNQKNRQGALNEALNEMQFFYRTNGSQQRTPYVSKFTLVEARELKQMQQTSKKKRKFVLTLSEQTKKKHSQKLLKKQTTTSKTKNLKKITKKK